MPTLACQALLPLAQRCYWNHGPGPPWLLSGERGKNQHLHLKELPMLAWAPPQPALQVGIQGEIKKRTGLPRNITISAISSCLFRSRGYWRETWSREAQGASVQHIHGLAVA